MARQRVFIRQLLTAAALAALILLSACSKSAQPTSGAPAESPAALATAGGGSMTTALPPESGNTPGPDEQATRDAALDNSGKPGPTLPAGDLQPQTEAPESIATATSASVQADSGSVATPNQTVPGDSQATLSPDQLATRDAALDNSGKSGPTPPAGTASPASNCLRSAGLILLPMAALAIRRRKR